MQRVLKISKMRNLTLEGKISYFKTIAISKIVFQSFITTVPKLIINELEKYRRLFCGKTSLLRQNMKLFLKIQEAILWKNSTPKTKHETVCHDYKAGALKNIHIQSNTIVLQYSWIRRLDDNSFHEWTLILIYLIEKYLGNSFIFFIQIYLLRVIKPSFCHLSIEKFYCTGKNILV